MDSMIALCDKTSNDIRSSLNTLQFLSKKTNKVVVIFLPFFEVLHTMVPRTGTILFKKPTNEKKINIILQF